MLHSKHITTSASITEANSFKTQFLVNRGVIYRVWLSFPAGCSGLLKVRFFHEGHPFLPVDQDAYISGNDFTFVYPLMYEILESPEVITIETWNSDDTHAHTIDVQLLVIPKEWVQPVGAYEGIIAALRSLFVRR